MSESRETDRNKIDKKVLDKLQISHMAFNIWRYGTREDIIPGRSFRLQGRYLDPLGWRGPE
jgi:hypothetical protein